MFYLNTIEQLLLFVEQLDQLEVYLPYSRLLTGIQILLVFQLEVQVDRLLTGISAQQKGTTARWYSNKISLSYHISHNS